ncbi:DUF348 domain-containing protein [Clostridium tetani]|nr:DUF348 domain-containing protein [Clostridium tetani]
MTMISNLKDFCKRNNSKKLTAQTLIILSIIVVTTFVAISRKSITLIIDGEEKKLATYQNNVQNFLAKEDIKLNPKDKIDKDMDSKLSNKDVINIKRAVNVQINVDNKELAIKSAEKDIASMLEAEKIVLGSEDKILPGKDTTLSDGMKVDITRVEKKTITQSAPVNFNTVVKNDSSMLKSKKKVLQEGQKGEKQITTNVVYENGKEISRKVIKETITKKPKDKIIAQGTLSPIPVSRGTTTSFANSGVLRVKATAYWAVHGVNNTYTYSGRKAVRNPNGYSTIAVDPRVIPLGTKLYVEGYGYAIAADTGTSVKGNFIDVYFDTHKEACNWGLKYVNVYIQN